MKKLKLQLDGKEMLTKEQMKKVVGADYGGGCPTGIIWISGYGVCHTSSCEQAQYAYNYGSASCNGSAYGTVLGYCCASCESC